MLELKYIVDSIELIKTNIQNRQSKIDLDEFIKLYKYRKEQKLILDQIRQETNEIARQFVTASEDVKQDLTKRSSSLKIKLQEQSKIVKDLDVDFQEEYSKIPNLTSPDTPIGVDDRDNKVIKYHGAASVFNFNIKDHVQIGESLDIIDFTSATKTTGSKFYFLKNEAVILELALVRFALDKAKAKGYSLMSTPDIAKNDIIVGSGYSPRGEETQIYSIENSDLSLIGTSEIQISGYYSNTIIPKNALPLKIAAISHCFRTEAGSYGKESKGLYRVHQFTKVELYQITLPELSNAALDDILELEESIYQDLGIPYRVVSVCSGDLGASAYKKYDIEAWMPSKESETNESYGEITSASNCTDYQSRRLNISYKDNDTKKLAHTLNGTAVAISRTLMAILENYQQEDGSVIIPKALQAYTGFSRITAIK